MADYQQILDPISGALSGAIKRTADGATIPDDPGNRDRRAYEAWVEQGNVPDEPDPLPEPAPEENDIEARLFALTERIEACEARLAVLEGRRP